jgi:oxygen-dependent protoporphyrinogen oxidase
VIIATGAHQAGRIVAGMDAGLAEMLLAIPSATSAVVTLAYRREKIAHPLDGFGFVMPQREGRSILACTFSSVKFSGRAPDGCVLLRVFLGGSLQEGVLDRDDAALASTAIREVDLLLRIAGAPDLIRVHRHREAMPQYLVGHLDRVAAIEARAARHPGVALAGAAYRGVGIPDCIRSGEEAAERALTACRRTQAAV